MIESVMYISIGVLVAALFGLLFAPLLHDRAVRLTTRRLDAALPLSIIEVRADKDQLRAEFAMSIRRLETGLERMRTKTAAHLMQMSKKTEAINKLKKELEDKSATIAELEARDGALRKELAIIRKQFEVSSLRKAAPSRPDKEADLRKQLAGLVGKSRLLDEREFDIKRRRDQLDNAGEIADLQGDAVAIRAFASSATVEMRSKIERLEALLSAMVEARSK
jgi:chromosome segregation ATPase